MTIEEILDLGTVENNYAIHYKKNNLLVASVYKDVTNLKIKAHLGDDKNILKFEFRHDGPVAIIYGQAVKVSNPMPMNTGSCVIAIMSIVTFADVSLFDELNPKIFPCEIGQYDIGTPHKFDIARQLICHHTGADWDEEFLPKKYQEYREAELEYFSTSSEWTA